MVSQYVCGEGGPAYNAPLWGFQIAHAYWCWTAKDMHECSGSQLSWVSSDACWPCCCMLTVMPCGRLCLCCSLPVLPADQQYGRHHQDLVTWQQRGGGHQPNTRVQVPGGGRATWWWGQELQAAGEERVGGLHVAAVNTSVLSTCCQSGFAAPVSRDVKTDDGCCNGVSCTERVHAAAAWGLPSMNTVNLSLPVCMQGPSMCWPLMSCTQSLPQAHAVDCCNLHRSL